MRGWLFLLAGLGIWAAHFFLLYAIASILPGRPLAPGLVLAVTAPAVVANLFVLRRAQRTAGRKGEIEGWISRLGGMAAAISLVAVLWQSLPALFA